MENPNIQNNVDIDELIINYFVEGLHDADKKRLEQWIQTSTANKKYFNDLQEIWVASIDSGKLKVYDRKKAYRRFLLYTQKEIREKTNIRHFYLRYLLYGVASVFLLLIVFYASYWGGSEKLKNQFTDMVVETPLGSKTKLHLPDGSLVWLNAGSSICYSQGFGVENRQIHLRGEGYFEITPNEKHPFIVYTEGLHTTVVGTKFNVRNYIEEEEISVSLLEGKVLVTNAFKSDDKVVLAPNQKVFFNKKSRKMKVSKVKAQYTTKWINGYLFFDEIPLVDIVKELERTYNAKIILMDKSLESLRFYGHFIHKEQTIDEIIDLLSSTGKIKYEKTEKEIKLSSR